MSALKLNLERKVVNKVRKKGRKRKFPPEGRNAISFFTPAAKNWGTLLCLPARGTLSAEISSSTVATDGEPNQTFFLRPPLRTEGRAKAALRRTVCDDLVRISHQHLKYSVITSVTWGNSRRNAFTFPIDFRQRLPHTTKGPSPLPGRPWEIFSQKRQTEKYVDVRINKGWFPLAAPPPPEYKHGTESHNLKLYI